MSGFTYSFALDYMLSVIDVSTKAFTIVEDVPVPRSITTRQSSSRTLFPVARAIPPPPVAVEEITNVIEIDLNKIEVIMLESLEMPDAMACVFNCFAKVNVRLEADVILINGTVTKISMGVANYLMYFDNAKLEEYIMSPTALTLNGTIKGISTFFPNCHT